MSATIVHELGPKARELVERFLDLLERTVPRRRRLHFSRGVERPRTTKEPVMASEVHRGNELAYPIHATDPVTNRAAGLEGITWTPTVEPADAGVLFPPDASGEAVFQANETSGASTCALELRAEFDDGSPPQTFTDSVTIDPDGRVLSMGQAVERARSA